MLSLRQNLGLGAFTCGISYATPVAYRTPVTIAALLAIRTCVRLYKTHDPQKPITYLTVFTAAKQEAIKSVVYGILCAKLATLIEYARHPDFVAIYKRAESRVALEQKIIEATQRKEEACINAFAKHNEACEQSIARHIQEYEQEVANHEQTCAQEIAAIKAKLAQRSKEISAQIHNHPTLRNLLASFLYPFR